MADTTPRLWKRIVGYGAFTIFALTLSFFVTFPYEPLKEQIKMQADHLGLDMTINSLGPGFFSLRAGGIEIGKKVEGDQVAERLKIDSLSIAPMLFPPGVSVKVSAMGGDVSVAVSGMSSLRVKANIDEIDLSRGNVKGYTGVDLAGSISGVIDVSIPKTAAASGSTTEPDLTQMSGSVRLDTKNVTVNGGTISVPIPQYGPDPTPVDLPKIVFGDILGRITIDKGAAAIDEFTSKSSDLESAITGSLKMGKKLEYSESNLEIRLKPDPEFQKRLGMIGMALSRIGADPKDPAWRMGRLTGYIGRPQFR